MFFAIHQNMYYLWITEEKRRRELEGVGDQERARVGKRVLERVKQNDTERDRQSQ